MSIFDKAFGAFCTIGAVGLFIAGIEDDAKKSRQEQMRKETTCRFDEISKDEFRDIVVDARKHIKRITTYTVVPPVVNCTVRSQSGISTWNFSIDFNDYGCITGRYWLKSENKDSTLPKYMADTISQAIQERTM